MLALFLTTSPPAEREEGEDPKREGGRENADSENADNESLEADHDEGTQP